MKWCNMFQCWCDDLEDIVEEETIFETCGMDCSDCDFCEEEEEEE